MVRQITMTAEQFREYQRTLQGGHYVGRSADDTRVLRKPKTDKYHAEKDSGYDSRKEKRRADVLRILERQGEISELREQVRYELIPKQFDTNGKLLELPISYVADFVYKDKDGHTVVEDTKGVRTREYIIKRKLMLYFHNITIVEI